MLQKFLDGKKKYSAFIITALVTIIPLLIQEPEAQKTFMDMVPSLAAALAGIFYIVTQGGIDKEKDKAKAATATNGSNGSTATTSIENVVMEQPVEAQAIIQPANGAAAVEPPAEPFDAKAFHERVLNDASLKYSESNPTTIFYEARDKGGLTTCTDIKQAQDYWDYLVTLAYDSEQYVREQTNVDSPGPCKVRSPEHVQAQMELTKTIRCRDNVYALANTSIDWKAKLGINNTLRGVGVLAEELLKYK
jgi:hypothetical protein